MKTLVQAFTMCCLAAPVMAQDLPDFATSCLGADRTMRVALGFRDDVVAAFTPFLGNEYRIVYGLEPTS